MQPAVENVIPRRIQDCGTSLIFLWKFQTIKIVTEMERDEVKAERHTRRMGEHKHLIRSQLIHSQRNANHYVESTGL